MADFSGAILDINSSDLADVLYPSLDTELINSVDPLSETKILEIPALIIDDSLTSDNP